MEIAILGATSHIAKGLILELGTRLSLTLFARNPSAVKDFLETEFKENGIQVMSLDLFPDYRGDGVINCIGFGTPRVLAEKGHEVFRLTEYFDEQVHSFLVRNPGSIAINMSSGAVYSGTTQYPITESSAACIAVNALCERDFYQIAKLNSEAKHRSWKDLSVVDIRVFGYFSKFVDLQSGYLVTDLLNSVLSKKVFKTGSENVFRDYVGSSDLATLVWNILTGKRQNCAIDIYSKQMVSKLELIDFFSENHGLSVEILPSPQTTSPTGAKPEYYSKNFCALDKFNYMPRASSLEVVTKSCEDIINSVRSRRS